VGLLGRSRGQSMVEYAVIMVLAVLLVVGGVVAFSHGLVAAFDSIHNGL
jgi:Flp pilus assembly pilin Flp